MDVGVMPDLAEKSDQSSDSIPDLQNRPGDKDLFLRKARLLGFSAEECKHLLTLYFPRQSQPFR